MGSLLWVPLGNEARAQCHLRGEGRSLSPTPLQDTDPFLWEPTIQGTTYARQTHGRDFFQNTSECKRGFLWLLHTYLRKKQQIFFFSFKRQDRNQTHPRDGLGPGEGEGAGSQDRVGCPPWPLSVALTNSHFRGLARKREASSSGCEPHFSARGQIPSR